MDRSINRISLIVAIYFTFFEFNKYNIKNLITNKVSGQDYDAFTKRVNLVMYVNDNLGCCKSVC